MAFCVVDFLPGQRRYRARLPQHEIETVQLTELFSGAFATPRTLAPAPVIVVPAAPDTPTKRCRTREFSTVVTPSMQEVLRIVTRIAVAGEPMPNNPTLGEICGGRGRSSALRALRRLQFCGYLSIERRDSKRRVVIVSTSQATGWGDARPGHSPYLHRRPGEPWAPRPRAARRPESRPLRPQVSAPPPPSPRALAAAHAPANSCQMPTWADGQRPGAAQAFCGEPSIEHSSFCRSHHELCFISSPAQRALRYVDGPRHLDKRRFNRTASDAPPVKVVDIEELFDLI